MSTDKNTKDSKNITNSTANDNDDTTLLDALLEEVVEGELYNENMTDTNTDPSSSTTDTNTISKPDTNEESEEEEEDDDSDDDDDNIVVIMSSSDKEKNQAALNNQAKKNESVTSENTDVATTAAAIAAAAAPTQVAAQINAVEADESVYSKDLESYADKPWRRPGADRTDYFNYNFDEDTWRLYCAKQLEMRQTQAALAQQVSSNPPRQDTYRNPHMENENRKRQRR